MAMTLKTKQERMLRVEKALKAGQVVKEAISKAEPIKIPEEDKKKIIEELKKIISPERVRDEPHVVAAYGGPAFTVGNKALSYNLPDMVVYPESREEVKGILKIASRHKIPVTVACMQSTVPANSPYLGGIFIDLMSMNRIHKIDTEHGYVVVEPGVRVAQIMNEIKPKGYAMAKGSYYSSFSAIATLVAWMAMNNFCNRMYDQIIGLEMVTPDGSTLYTGTMLYGDSELWTDVQHSFARIKDIFMSSYGTIGVITKAAIRIWPLLDGVIVPVFSFDDLEPAFRWSHAMSKSSMVDQTMVWGWPDAGLIEYKHTGAYLDYIEARMNSYQDETPKEVDLPNCFAWAQMRGYKEETEGAVKAAKRLAEQYGGKYLTEDELERRWPVLKRYWESMMMEGETNINPEQLDFTTQFMGTVDEIISLYRGLVGKYQEFGYKNWHYYTRMFHSGQTPWFRFFPRVEGDTPEEIQESLRIRDEITKYALGNYDVSIMKNDFFLNDPENPEHFTERGEPIHRLLSAVRKEFDPQGIMTPVMKKYTLL